MTKLVKIDTGVFINPAMVESVFLGDGFIEFHTKNDFYHSQEFNNTDEMIKFLLDSGFILEGLV